MDKAEAKHIAEINRVKAAIAKTNSKHLIADYNKYLRELERDLQDYRMFKEGMRYGA